MTDSTKKSIPASKEHILIALYDGCVGVNFKAISICCMVWLDVGLPRLTLFLFCEREFLKKAFSVA